MGSSDSSSGRSRKTIPIVALFIAAAAVAGYFMYFYPPASQEDTAGTIGAVKKYRVQQISENDVVLAGQEEEKAQARHADFLNDAAKLQSVGTALGSLASRLASQANLDAKALENAEAEFGNLSHSLENQAAELEQRGRLAMQIQLDAMNKALAGSATQLESSQLEAARKSIANVTEQLNNAQALDSRRLKMMAAELAGASEILEGRRLRAAASLESAQGELLGYRQKIESASQLESSLLENLRGAVGNYTSEMENAVALESSRLEGRRLYSEALALENQSLAEARRRLDALSRDGLGKRSADLLGVARQIESQASQLAARSLKNIEAELGARKRLGQSIVEMKSSVEALSSRLSNAEAQVESRSALQSTAAALDSFRQALDNRGRDIANRSIGAMYADLGAVEKILQNHEALDSRLLENMRGYMNRLSTELGSRNESLEAQAAATLQSRLGAASQALEQKATSLGQRSRP